MTYRTPRTVAGGRSATLTQQIVPTIAALVLACLVGPSTLRAQDDKLPKAEAILDKYVEVTGGKAVYAKLNNRVSTGTLEIVGLGLKFSMTVCGARPNKFYSRLESEAMGTVEKGCNGQVAWEISTMRGPQIKAGEEKALIMRNATFDGVVNWRKLFKKAECVGIDTVDGKPCYKLVLTPKEGEAVETRHYDKESHLFIKSAFTLRGPMGEIPIEVYRSDYKEVDGVLLPHKIRQVVAGMQETHIVTESIKHNVELPKDRFKLPDEVRALVDREKRSKAETKNP